MKVLFIHRSVGQGIISKGELRTLLQPSVMFDDFNNNTGVLTQHSKKTSLGMLKALGNDTTPSDLERLFTQWPEILDNYDLVAIRSCYPNSHIKDADQLEKIKAMYTRMIDCVRAHQKHLLIVTTPPLRPGFTNNREISHADALAMWLVAQTSEQVTVFDLRHLLSEEGVLKRMYRSWMPWDNHPNRHGYRASAKKFAAIINQISLRSHVE